MDVWCCVLLNVGMKHCSEQKSILIAVVLRFQKAVTHSLRDDNQAGSHMEGAVQTIHSSVPQTIHSSVPVLLGHQYAC